MATERDTPYERDDQGGEQPCLMCLLDEDGLLPDRRDAVPTHPHVQNAESPATHDLLASQRGADEDASTLNLVSPPKPSLNGHPQQKLAAL